ncbi:MAG: lamin tail domain-containing protein [Phycisphaerales bacterium]|nr:lamin tail domain-containing protein [Phycisphaerales bacterium]
MTAALAAFGGTALAASDLVISQVYGGGGNTGATYNRDFIEIFNRGASAIELSGKSVQYASATGTSWSKFDFPSFSLQPGQYFLVGGATGANGAALPTVDGSSSINLSASAGKVALVDSTTALTGNGCPIAAPIIDYLGFGATANCSEGTTTPTISGNTTANIRNDDGCTDTDDNGADFSQGTPTPRNSASTLNPCGGDPTGACCDSNTNTCSLTTAAACVGAGLSYLGDGASCAANACGFPTGACCNGGVCTIKTNQDCTTGGGTYQGNGSTCTPNPCVSCIDIATARAAAPGTFVKLCNVVIASTEDFINSGTSKSFTLQDNTGGITVFGTNAVIDGILLGRSAGDRIDIEGTTGINNGLSQMVAPFGPVTFVDTPGIPAAQLVTGADFEDGGPGESFESEIVRVNCVTFTTGGNFTGSANFNATDSNGDPIVVRISRTDQDIVGTPIPTGPVDIIGVFSQNDTTDPRDGGYQLLPRTLADFTDPSPNCPPDPTGACCNGRTCSVVTAAVCSTGGGTYQGNGSTCSPNPCLPCDTIADSEALAIGTRVKLCDLVISSTTDLIASTANKHFHAQDATGGITIFGTNAVIDPLLALAAVGDRITIEGTTGTFNGLFQLQAPFVLISVTADTAPTPDVVTGADFQEGAANAEFEESRLVRLNCATFVQTGVFAGATTYQVNTGAGQVNVRVSTTALDIVGVAIPTDPVDIIGIFSQFDTTDPRDGGYELLVRFASDLTGPTCPTTGACCVGVACTADVTSGDCTTLGGVFQGLGTGCSPNPCVLPTGACCLAGACTIDEEADCYAAGATYLGNNTTCPGSCPNPAAGPVQALDLAWGSNSSVGGSVHHVRSGSAIGRWSARFMQSVEFDNTGGGLGHSPDGNLLGADFGDACGGAPDDGGELWNLATDGSDRAELLFRVNGFEGTDCARTVGVSVNPSNNLVALMGQSNGTLYILNYSAGANPGTGTGASASANLSVTTVGQANISQGTAWYDDSNVLVAAQNPGDPSQNSLVNVTTGGSITDLEFFPARGTVGQVTDVEYNPAIAPYVFYMQSSFSTLQTPNSQSTLYVLDLTLPPGSRVIKTVILDNSLQTSREIALGSDRRLYIAQFGGSTAPQPKVYVDVLNLDTDSDNDIDAADIAALTDNSSVDYYVVPAGADSSFNGVDVANGVVAAPIQACCFRNGSCDMLTPAACIGLLGMPQGAGTNCTPNLCTAICLVGDANCDGVVNNFDIDGFVIGVVNNSDTLAPVSYLNLGGTQQCWNIRSCWGDINRNSLFNNFDIDPFVACIVDLPASGDPCPAP